MTAGGVLGAGAFGLTALTGGLALPVIGVVAGIGLVGGAAGGAYIKYKKNNPDSSTDSSFKTGTVPSRQTKSDCC